MNLKKQVLTGVLCASTILSTFNTFAKGDSVRLEQGIKSIATVTLQDEGLERILNDDSSEISKTFTLKKDFPDILREYEGEDKQELIEKYQLIWDYAVYNTYWVIKNMYEISKDSQEKIKHFGFEQYFKENLVDKVIALDYALQLCIENKEPNEEEIYELAKKSQTGKQVSGDKNPAPIININPIKYDSIRCIRARQKCIEINVSNDLMMLKSDVEFSTYEDLVRNNYSEEQYLQYLSDIINLNDLYLNAVRKSVDIPFSKIWAVPFVKSSVKKETLNASDYIVKLCVYLTNSIFNTDFTKESLRKYAKTYKR